MPKSKLRKGHKKRVQNYKNQKIAAEKQSRKILMEQYQKLQEEQSKPTNTQKMGDDVENNDIDVDIEIDDIEIDDN